MENSQQPLVNWIPNKLVEKDNGIYVEWVYLSDLKFAEPFFDETIAKCRSHAYNSKSFKVLSTIENTIDWSQEMVSVELKSLIFHISRCGSTMLSQSLATSSENIMISEAPIIDQILRNEIFGTETKTALLKAVLRFFGQKRFPKQKHLILKLDAWNIFEIDYLRSIFPNIPFALLYRNPGEVLRSHQKMAGMHMVPNLIPPAVFGITPNEIDQIDSKQYRALVLEKYFQGFLDFHQTDKNVIILNYNEGMKSVVEQFVSFIKVDYSKDEMDKMLERLKKHSKNESSVFMGDSYKDDVLIVNHKKADLLHQKLNENFSRQLAR
ncbi:sulfotransferase family protein [Flavobacterium hungaricum]|uniref:Sulfotransferase family protein n=1 Tax=Flavobacterium hungaricum TaxID=2082725 RepID=A0ABR9TR24_9FLAO|nr:sulfotransferase family protein [Flavobacterium hungaricum]MBE8727072.1 sulfotransferase family protein [Flavobacterium hungaricum]